MAKNTDLGAKLHKFDFGFVSCWLVTLDELPNFQD